MFSKGARTERLHCVHERMVSEAGLALTPGPCVWTIWPKVTFACVFASSEVLMRDYRRDRAPDQLLWPRTLFRSRRQSIGRRDRRTSAAAYAPSRRIATTRA